MDEGICYIDTRRIDCDPASPRPPVDAYELFCYVHLELQSPAQIPPLSVRFDPNRDTYLIVEERPTGTDTGLLLEAARLLGLSTLPCRILGATPQASQEQSPGPSAPLPPSLPSSSPSPEPDRPFLDPTRLDPLFRALCYALARMTGGVRRRTSRSALRIADGDDWRQEALLALWRELAEQVRPRLDCASKARRYVFGLLRNQAARAMQVGGRTSALPEDWAHSTRPVLDELIAAEEERRLDKAVEGLQALLEQANEALDHALSRLPEGEAAAARAWLDGASYRRAGLVGGLTLAQMRRVILRLRGRLAASPLRQAREDLEAIYRMCPSAATRIQLGRLPRLLADLEDNP